MVGKMNFNIETVKKQLKSRKVVGVDLDRVARSRSVLQFDKMFTFRILDDVEPEKYYHTLSCTESLPKIRIPMLFINSKADPISKW